jgi:cytochrome c
MEALVKNEILPFILAAIAAGAAGGAIWAVAAAEETTSRTPEAVQAAETAKALADPSAIPLGQRSFVKCQACHTVGESAQRRVGPPLNGVVGRAAGTTAEFRYSPAMQKSAADGLVWTVETLDAYLTAPREVVPGTTMGFAGIPKPDERIALIAYLASFAADGSRVAESSK